jgi:hypothetical protein
MGDKAKSIFTFQEQLWSIISQSLEMARKKANEAAKKNPSAAITFVKIKEDESEDINYKIEWIKIIIQGTEEQEKEEYEASMKLYSPLGKVLRKDMPADDNLKKYFQSKVLSLARVEEAYKQGYGSMDKNNISNKLLEMGILTHIEWLKDFDNRQVPILFSK